MIKLKEELFILKCIAESQSALNHRHKVIAATTLGDIYTLVLHPATSSHRALSAEERRRVGISDGLVRLSAGIEDAPDIIADLEQALATIP